jgi:hypothetical protein
MSKPEKITYIVGNEYIHRGKPVMIAESDAAGAWIAPTTEGGKVFHLPYSRIGELKQPEKGSPADV